MKRAFTLIELLVVVAIIGILSAILMTGIQSSRAKARDSKRISDINQIRVALEAYYEASAQFDQQYPSALSDLSGQNTKYLPTVPTDPGTKQAYGYSPTLLGGKRKGYCLAANLETRNNNRLQNANCTIQGFTEGQFVYKVQR